ncbi:MAG TPA: BatA domain-containing protein [Longimicrobiales bacterium]
MPALAFLAPAFLAGLAAVLIPVILHLRHRERSEAVAFPSLMFLQQIPYRTVKRQRIRHWPLLLVRCLILALLAAAFARPFFAGAGPGIVEDGARDLVILLDRSYSMGYAGRWARAQDAAKRALEGMGPDDRAALVFFSTGATAASGLTGDVAALRAAVDAAQPGAGGTRYGPPLELARRLLEASDRARREVVLITDFQRVGWDGQQDVRLPAGVPLTTVDVAEGDDVSNLSITGVSFDRQAVGGRERVTATARIAYKGAGSMRGVPVRLELNGIELQALSVDLEPNSARAVTFDPFTLPEGESRGTVSAGTDALPPDNRFHFVLSPGQAVSVLIVETDGAAAQRSLYLRRALGIGDRPPFRVEVMRRGALSPDAIAGRDVVVLNDAPFPAGAAGRALLDHVRRGGGLIITLGERSAPSSWEGDAAELLPGPFGAPVDGAARGVALASLDRSHPIFEVFRAPRSGDFTTARVYRYRPLQVGGADGVLARYDDGGVALAEKRVGRGRVLVWTSTLDNFWTDIALQPIYLPFVHQLVRHAAGYVEARPWFTAGQVLDLSGGDADAAAPQAGDEAGTHRAMAKAGQAAGEPAPLPALGGGELVVLSPGGARSTIGGDRPRVLELQEQGFYELRPAGRAAAAPYTVAVNLDLAESDLSRLDPQELAAAAMAADPGPAAPATAAAAGGVEEQERRQALWRYLLILALLALAAEIALANRVSRAAG